MKTLLTMLLFAAVAAQAQSDTVAMPAPVSKKPMEMKATLKQRLYFVLNGEMLFWDCQEIIQEKDRYIAITKYGNGTIFERFVPINQFHHISKLR